MNKVAVYGHCYVQLREGASAVREMVMVLVGSKIAPQRNWLPLLFHTIPVMESAHPPVFTLADSQQLLSRVQVTLLQPLLFQSIVLVVEGGWGGGGGGFIHLPLFICCFCPGHSLGLLLPERISDNKNTMNGTKLYSKKGCMFRNPFLCVQSLRRIKDKVPTFVQLQLQKYLGDALTHVHLTVCICTW